MGGTTSVDDQTNFPDFEARMQSAGDGYQWESFEVVTDDDYCLNIFHIIGDADGNSSPNDLEKGPVLLLHGLGGSADDWIAKDTDASNKALPTFLFDNDYDVWLFNVRGNKYSCVPDDENAPNPNADTAEFWSFTRDQNALYDLANSIFTVMENVVFAPGGGCEKLKIIGSSAGGETVLRALLKDVWIQREPLLQFTDVVDSIIMLAPALVGNKAIFGQAQQYLDPLQLSILVANLEAIGVHYFFGPDFDTDVLPLIADASPELAALVEAFRPLATPDPNDPTDTRGPFSLRLLEELAQGIISGRWQEYIDTGLFAGECINSPEFDPETLKTGRGEMRISTYLATRDLLIDNQKVTDILKQIQGTTDKRIFTIESDHYLAGDNDDAFLARILNDLKSTAPPLETGVFQCS